MVFRELQSRKVLSEAPHKARSNTGFHDFHSKILIEHLSVSVCVCFCSENAESISEDTIFLELLRKRRASQALLTQHSIWTKELLTSEAISNFHND